MKCSTRLATLIALALAGPAGAAATFTQTPLYLPSGMLGFDSQYAAAQNATGLVESQSDIYHAQISQIGAISNGRLPRSQLIVPHLDEVYATAFVPERPWRVLVMGDMNMRPGSIDDGVALYSTTQAAPLWKADGMYHSHSRHIVVTRYASDADLDFVIAGSAGSLQMFNAAAPTQRVWFLPTSDVSSTTRALVTLPAGGGAPARVAVLTDRHLTVVDAATGALYWQTPMLMGDRLAAGDLNGDGQADLVVGGYYIDLRALNVATRQVLWTRTDESYDALVLGDADGNGRQDVLTQSENELRWFNGANGSPLGLPAWLPLGLNYSARLTLADVQGNNQKEVISVVAGGNVPGVYVYTLSLQNQLLKERAALPPVDQFRLGDVDADGQGEVVSLAVPQGSPFYSSLLRISSLATGAEEWSGWSGPSTTTPLTSGDKLADLDLAQLDADPAQEIVAVGENLLRNPVLDVFDGASHALQQRVTLNLPGSGALSSVRALPPATPGGTSDLLVAAARNTNSGVNLHRLDSALQPRWNLELPGFYAEIRLLELRQMDADPSLEAVIGADYRVWIVDLQEGTVQLDLATSARIHAVQMLAAGPRIVSFNASPGELLSHDAASGELRDRFALRSQYAAISFDPADPDRLFALLDTRRVHALRLSSAREEGHSGFAVSPYGYSDYARATLTTHAGQVLLGDANGVWALGFTPDSAEAPLFADGFETPLFQRLPLQPPQTP